jgi:hypothetical protein
VGWAGSDQLAGAGRLASRAELLRSDPAVGEAGGGVTFLVFQFAMGQTTLDAQALQACQAAADAFVAAPAAHRAVIVGALSHWVTITFTKTGRDGGGGGGGDDGGEEEGEEDAPLAGPVEPARAGDHLQLEVLLWDSNDVPVLGLDAAALEAIAHRRARERGWDRQGSAGETRRCYYLRSLCDLQGVVALLTRLFAGHLDLRAEAADGAVGRLLDDYRDHVTLRGSGDAHHDAATAADAGGHGRQPPQPQHETGGEAAADMLRGNPNPCHAEGGGGDGGGGGGGRGGSGSDRPHHHHSCGKSSELEVWLRERQPPPVLRSGLVRPLTTWGRFLSPARGTSLLRWVADASARSHFPIFVRLVLTEIYLCHACSCQEILRMETPRRHARSRRGRACMPRRSGSPRPPRQRRRGLLR